MGNRSFSRTEPILGHRVTRLWIRLRRDSHWNPPERILVVDNWRSFK